LKTALFSLLVVTVQNQTLYPLKEFCLTTSIKYRHSYDALDSLENIMDHHIDAIIIYTDIGAEEAINLIETISRDSNNKNLPIILISHLSDNEKLAKKISDFFVISLFSYTYYLHQLKHLLTFLKNANSNTSSLQQELRQSEEKNIIDPLTGAYNRNGAKERYSHLHSRVLRHNEPFSIIMLDIDYFKNVNDTYGHDIGDEILIALSSLMLFSIRQDDSLIRLGGEEFVLFIANVDLLEADEIAQKLRNVINSKKHSNENIAITCSFGVVEYQKGEGLEDSLKRADILLYMAKEEGRDRVISFSD